ncbi:hypothetical protein AALP_AA4G217900 [Arabis alpina]|uniref:Uncharacterized protein n=1 Tax=Arabis alpina TaxID=50452 RepID=A0A087H4T5_ARAAL|nr:hypothetical protein AALP_AA4G217900 [Arabis alpina]
MKKKKNPLLSFGGGVVWIVYCLQYGFGGNRQEGALINDQGLRGCEFDQLQCIDNHNLGGNGMDHSNSSRS